MLIGKRSEMIDENQRVENLVPITYGNGMGANIGRIISDKSEHPHSGVTNQTCGSQANEQ